MKWAVVIGVSVVLAVNICTVATSPAKVSKDSIISNLEVFAYNDLPDYGAITESRSKKELPDYNSSETEDEKAILSDEIYENLDDKTLIPYMKPATGVVLAGLYYVIWMIFKLGSLVFKFWKFVLNLLFKPLLKLYLMPLRLIHTYLLPDLISEECFKDYHSAIHSKNDPFVPFRPHKWELVKCIFQYAFHYIRQWQFVNRIENNAYALI